jgi:predicted methyltransferase
VSAPPLIALLTACGLTLAGCQRPGARETPASPPAAQPASPARNGAARAPLFPPADLQLLEAPDRDEWQQPELVMDQLNIAEASRVGDVGAGSGWFTSRLAHRVGPNGLVVAEDIQRGMIDAIERRVRDEGLANVRVQQGERADPRLPSGLHAVLIVDAYPEFSDPIGLLSRIGAALAPGGRLGIVDFRVDGSGGPGPPIDQRVGEDVVIAEAGRAGFTLQSRATFLRDQYLLVFNR